MKCLKAKLNSSRGASMVIALVFFLICITVASIVLTAATAAAGRLDKRRDEQQAYLAALSAADLLCENYNAGNPGLTAVTYTFQRSQTHHACALPQHADSATPWTTEFQCPESILLREYLSAAAAEIRGGSTLARQRFTMESEAMSDTSLSCQLEMDGEYNVKCVVTATVAQESYSMSLFLDAGVQNEVRRAGAGSCTHWEQSYMKEYNTATSAWEYMSVQRSYPITVTTEEHTVTWFAARLQRGGNAA